MSPNPQLAPLAGSVLFTVDGAPFTWADAVLAAGLDGRWAQLERSTWEGLTAQRDLGSRGLGPSHAEMTEAAKRFRYARRLLAADDLEAWLARWRLSIADWRDHLRRELCRGEQGSVAAQPDAAEVGAVVGVDAICSGALEQAAHRLAAQASLALPELMPAEAPIGADTGDLALVLGIPPESASERLALLARIWASADAAGTQAVSVEAIERELAEHRLDWLHLELDVLTLAATDAAHEAVLCVRSDGLALTSVADEAGASVGRMAMTLDDAPDWLAPHLLGVTEGSIVGPLAAGDGFSVVTVTAKREPVRSDETSRALATAALLERAARVGMASRLVWHEHPSLPVGSS